MSHKFFTIVVIVLTSLLSSAINGQEKSREERLALNPLVFSKKISFTGAFPEAITFPTTLTTQPSFSMEQKSLNLPAISLDLKNAKPLYISPNFKPTINYSDYLNYDPTMNSRSVMESMAVEYLINRYVGSLKLIKSNCNSRR